MTDITIKVGAIPKHEDIVWAIGRRFEAVGICSTLGESLAAARLAMADPFVHSVLVQVISEW